MWHFCVCIDTNTQYTLKHRLREGDDMQQNVPSWTDYVNWGHTAIMCFVITTRTTTEIPPRFSSSVFSSCFPQSSWSCLTTSRFLFIYFLQLWIACIFSLSIAMCDSKPSIFYCVYWPFVSILNVYFFNMNTLKY